MGFDVLAPDEEAAGEGVFVAADDAAGRAVLELFDVAAAEDDVVGAERYFQRGGYILYVFAPALFPEALEAAEAEVVLVGLSLFVAEMGQLHRLENAVDDHGGAEAGAEAEEQHAAAFVAADGLHRGVVD